MITKSHYFDFIVPGGGVALLRAIDSISELMPFSIGLIWSCFLPLDTTLCFELAVSVLNDER